jgi:hypothetical protein
MPAPAAERLNTDRRDNPRGASSATAVWSIRRDVLMSGSIGRKDAGSITSAAVRHVTEP